MPLSFVIWISLAHGQSGLKTLKVEIVEAKRLAGVVADWGDRVTIDYEVRADNKLVDSTIKRNLPFTFLLEKVSANYLAADVHNLALGHTKKFKVKNRRRPTDARLYPEFDSAKTLSVVVTLRRLQRGDALLRPE